MLGSIILMPHQIGVKRRYKEDQEKLARNLLTAAEENIISEVGRLFSQGAQDKYTSDNGYSALHWAAHHNNLKMAGLLVANGADPLCEAEGLTPIQVAADRGSAEVLQLCIKAAYSRYIGCRGQPPLPLSLKAIALGNTVSMALAHSIFIAGKKPKELGLSTEEVLRLIKHLRPFLMKAENDYQQLAYEIGLYLFKKNRKDLYSGALTFFILAGDYHDPDTLQGTSIYKAYCYRLLSQSPTDDLKDAQPETLSDMISEQALRKIIRVTHLLPYFKKQATRSGSFCNELAEIYDMLGFAKMSRQYAEQGAWLRSRVATLRLAREGRMKYQFICDYFGWEGQEQKEENGLTSLVKAIEKNKMDMANFLKKVYPYVASDLLKTPDLLQVKPHFAIRLYEMEVVQSQLSSEERGRFLLGCATACPKYSWMAQDDPFLTLLPSLEQAMVVQLKTTYLIMRLLNNDVPSEDMASAASLLLNWKKQHIHHAVALFSPFYEEATLKRVRHIIKMYQYLIKHDSLTLADWPYSLDGQGLHQLFSLLDKNKEVKHKHRLESLVQEAALKQATKEMNACEKEEREAMLKEAMADPLFKKRSTFLCNPLRMFPSEPMRALKKQKKMDEVAQKKSLRN